MLSLLRVRYRFLDISRRNFKNSIFICFPLERHFLRRQNVETEINVRWKHKGSKGKRKSPERIMKGLRSAQLFKRSFSCLSAVFQGSEGALNELWNNVEISRRLTGYSFFSIPLSPQVSVSFQDSFRAISVYFGFHFNFILAVRALSWSCAETFLAKWDRTRLNGVYAVACATRGTFDGRWKWQTCIQCLRYHKSTNAPFQLKTYETARQLATRRRILPSTISCAK